MPEIGERLLAKDRQAWRRWLHKHHASKTEIWLILYKKHVCKPCVSYDEAVEEALCYGWIDGILKRIDGEEHVVRFSPRRRRSVWSESNKQRVAKLIRAGKMTEAGLALVRAAKQSGQWQRATEREFSDVVPPDLERALKANPIARERFAKLAPSHRRSYLGWILDAKREETRARRIQKTVERVAQGRPPGIG